MSIDSLNPKGLSKAQIRTLAARHRHAMNMASKAKDRETTTRNLWYRQYRTSRVAFQAGILEASEDEYCGNDPSGRYIAELLEWRDELSGETNG